MIHLTRGRCVSQSTFPYQIPAISAISKFLDKCVVFRFLIEANSVHATSSEPVKCHVVSHKSAKIKRGVKKTPSLRRQRDRPRSVGYRVAGAGAGPFPSPPLPLLPRLHFAHLKKTPFLEVIFSHVIPLLQAIKSNSHRGVGTSLSFSEVSPFSSSRDRCLGDTRATPERHPATPKSSP